MRYANRRRAYVSRFRSRVERELVDQVDGTNRSEYGGSYGGGGGSGGSGSYRSSFYSSRRSGSSFGGSSGGGGSRENWYRVVLNAGNGYSKSLVSTTINDYSTKPIQLLNYHTDARTGRILFFIHSRDEAEEIRRLSRSLNIQDKHVNLIIHRVDEPNYTLDNESLDLMKVYLSSRYNAEIELLDLSNFAENQELQSMGIFVTLRRPQSYDQIFQLAEELFPKIKVLNLSSNQLTSLDFLRSRFKGIERLNLSNNQIHRLRELDSTRHMRLIEINILDNPLANQFSCVDDLTSLMRDKHPRLTIMNGVALPPKIGFAVDDDHNTLPETLYHFVPEDLKSGVTNFMKLYFELFDSDNRQTLINAYHENAALSVAINTIRASRFDRYAKEGRNFLKINDEVSRFERLKRSRCDIVSLFVRLPPTLHILNSFKADVFFRRSNSFSMALSGLYRESVDDGHKDRERFQIRSFYRVFHCVLDSSGNMIIVAEHFHIRECTDAQHRYAHSSLTSSTSTATTDGSPGNRSINAQSTMSSPSSSSVGRSSLSISRVNHSPSVSSTHESQAVSPTATNGNMPPRQSLESTGGHVTTMSTPKKPSDTDDNAKVEKLMKATGMNYEYSKECLAQNNWDFNKACSDFLELNMKKQIPSDAFVVSERN